VMVATTRTTREAQVPTNEAAAVQGLLKLVAMVLVMAGMAPQARSAAHPRPTAAVAADRLVLRASALAARVAARTVTTPETPCRLQRIPGRGPADRPAAV